MLDIFANTLRTATRSGPDGPRHAGQADDLNRRYPWRGHRWGNRRNTRSAQRRIRGMSDHMLQDIGITRANIDRLFD